MRRIREVLRLHAAMGNNISAIAQGGGMSRSTVREYLKRATAAGIDAVSADTMTDEALEAALFGPPEEPKRPLPDWAKLDEELRKHKHVTRKLLWLEYKADHPDGYEFSQFKLLLKAWQKEVRARPVDAPGPPRRRSGGGRLCRRQSHHRRPGRRARRQYFVACLPCSGLIYAEGSWTQGADDWLSSHVRLFRFLGGVPAKVMPDNLKVGVTHASY